MTVNEVAVSGRSTHFPFGAFQLFELSIWLISKEPDFSLLELVVLLVFCIIMIFLSSNVVLRGPS